jgi:hypothetical protein
MRLLLETELLIAVEWAPQTMYPLSSSAARDDSVFWRLHVTWRVHSHKLN